MNNQHQQPNIICNEGIYLYLMLNIDDYIVDEVHEGPTLVHQNKIKDIFQSKHELWKFLAGDGEVYLPDYHNSSMFVSFFYLL